MATKKITVTDEMLKRSCERANTIVKLCRDTDVGPFETMLTLGLAASIVARIMDVSLTDTMRSLRDSVKLGLSLWFESKSDT